jgi:S1-C subfamily serine protease
MNQGVIEFSDALASAVERAESSVVRVDGGRRRSLSGTVFSEDGVIVTALHGLEREEGIEVFDGAERVAASWVGAEPALDLAVLRAERKVGKVPEFAPESELRRGQLALSVSRPGKTPRVQLGVVSGLAGEWRAPRGAKVSRYVELGLPIEAGFSGGLAIDPRGRALGVAMAGILRATALVLTRVTLERVVSSLLEHGRVQRAYLGVSSQPVRLPEALAEKTGQRVALLVAGVEPGGPAEQAGIGLGDVLFEASGARLGSLEDLFGVLEPERIEQPLHLRLLRGGVEQALTVTPRARP